MDSYAEDGLDENGVKISITGSLWKLKKSLFGKPIWKRRWVSCDGIVLSVWNLPNKAERGAIEKYKFKLDSCNIETPDVGVADRSNVFKLTDVNTNMSVSLAADTADLRERWVDFLTSDKEYDELLREVELKKRLEEERRRAELERLKTLDDEEEEEEVEWDALDAPDSTGGIPGAAASNSVAGVRNSAIKAPASDPAALDTQKRKKTVKLPPQQKEKELSVSEKITKYFHDNDIAASAAQPVIRVEDLLSLLQILDKNISENAVRLLTRVTRSSKFITLPDFLEWHGNYVTNTELSLEQSRTPVDASVEVVMSTQKRREMAAIDPVLYAAKDLGQRQKFCIGAFPDTHKDSAGILTTGVLDSELRSPMLKSVSMKALVDTVVPDIHRLILLDSDNSVDFQDDEHHVVSFEWNEAYQHHVDETSNVYVHPNNFSDPSELTASVERCQASVTSGLNRAAFQADFLQCAVDGARIIIDEYTLPDKFKTIRSIDRKALQKHLDDGKTASVAYQRDAHDEGLHLDDWTEDQAATFVDSSEMASVPSPRTPSKTADFYYDKYFAGESPAPSHPDHADGDSPSPSKHSEGTATPQSKLSRRSRRLSTVDMRKFQVGSAEMGHEEMFSYRGLLFRINARGVEEALDLDPSAARVHALVASDEVLHKGAGHEQRGLVFMKQAADAAFADQLDQFVNSHEADAESDLSKVLRARTLLETVVDYAGYRVTVTCPVDVNEDETLVLGYSGLLAPTPAGESVVSADPEEDRVYLDAFPPLKGLLPRLAEHLNVKVNRHACVASNSTLSSVDVRSRRAAFSRQVVESLSREMEVHRTSDGQIYFLNFAHLLLPDLPRSDTYDLETRRLRPEFNRAYTQRLDLNAYADALNADAENDESASVIGSAMKSVDGDGSRKDRPAEIEKVFKACRHLYVRILPDLARVLDMLGTVPIDSYSLTETFHSYGAGMHHLGAVYTLSKSQHVRQILVVEAIARACKVLLNNTLRLNARKAKAQTMAAETRSRSLQEHYQEYMRHAHDGRREATLQFFNLVLGSSKASTQFWSALLADTVFQKFSLQLPTASSTVSKYQVVHMPLLFLALQYHTGVQFADHCQYNFDASVGECALSHQDVLNYNLPKVKPLSRAPNHALSSGCIGRLDALAAPYLALGLYSKSTSLLRLRMSLQITNNQHFAGSADTSACASTAYLLAFSLFRSGKYSEAREIIKTQLEHGLKYSAMSGRLYVLLMCCYCRDSKENLKKAVLAFDAAKAVFSHVLGPKHPMHAMLMCALADQYNYLGHTNHAVALLKMAVDFSNRVLADHAHILTAAYQYKLAQLYLRIADTKSAPRGVRDHAFDSLTEALSTYDRLAIEGSPVTEEVINCLYDLTRLHMVLGRPEIALTTANRCRALCLANYGAAKVKGKGSAAYLPDHDSPLLPSSGVSCMLLLSDLLISQQNADQAVTILQSVWDAVRRAPSDYSSLGHIYTVLTGKMLAALYSQLPFPTRSLLQTIAAELELQSFAQHGVDIPGAWAKAQDTVYEAMWANQPKEYFRSLVEGVMHSEIEGHTQRDAPAEFVVAAKGGSFVFSDGRSSENRDGTSASSTAAAGAKSEEGDTNRLNMHALQVGVILRLISHSAVKGTGGGEA